MVLSQLLDEEILMRISAREGAVQLLEAKVLAAVLASSAIKKELSVVLERTQKKLQ
jgi:hypothetical protein